VDDDFDLFHFVLFYLYTDRVCFSTTESPEESDIPTTTDAEGVYAIAHRLMLDSLADKAMKFIDMSSTPENITARAFGKFASIHEPIAKIYDNYFFENWDEVLESREFDEYFENLEEDSVEYVRVNTKLRKMIQLRTSMAKPDTAKSTG
jgi:hypothetical protein